MTPEQNALLQLAICLGLYGAVAAIIYFIRLKIATLWSNHKAKSSET